ncbi:MAG TPA: Hsp20/alpha crystallin family protein [Nitrososphaerales archaeon]|nr:Hsp20/alpha crystallin family protein [Nitrososphaerales archaeon]
MNTTEKNGKPRKEKDTGSTALALPESIFQNFMKPFQDFMQPLFPSSMSSLLSEFGGREQSTDLQDRGDHYVLTAQLPGFEKKDVDVRVDSNVLELKAESKSERQNKKDNGAWTQRSHSYVHRYMTLPEEVLSEKVSGTMKNGVLELKLPKKEPKALERNRRVDLK